MPENLSRSWRLWNEYIDLRAKLRHLDGAEATAAVKRCQRLNDLHHRAALLETRAWRREQDKACPLKGNEEQSDAP